jgi:hypothetical protein
MGALAALLNYDTEKHGRIQDKPIGLVQYYRRLKMGNIRGDSGLKRDGCGGIRAELEDSYAR